MKILLGCAIILFSTFCGYFLTKQYRQRKAFFAQLYEFNQRFLNEISYYRRPLQEFMMKYNYQGAFKEILQCYLLSLSGEKFDLIEYTFLKEDERVFLIDYFQMLGKGDSVSQKAYYSSVRESLIKWKTSSDEQAKKYEDLYIKLGFLCGLFILILII